MNNASIVLALCLVLLSSSVRSQTQPQYFAGTGHWYQVVSSPNLSWTQARDAAAAAGGYLACIVSQAENDFITGLNPPPPATWIGGTDQVTEEDWQWVSGEPWSFTHWGSNEPSNGGAGEDYLEIWTSTNHSSLKPGDWNDDATTQPSYVVEYNSDPGSFCAGNALQFDGNDDEVVIPDSPTLNFAPGSSMTVECWFKVAQTPSNVHILGRRTSCSGNMNYQIAISANQLIFSSPGNKQVAKSFVPELNRWYHVAGTYDGSTPRLYIDGTEQGTQSGSSSLNDSAPLKIGGSADCEHFAGQIDEVRLWNVARSATEINANMHQSVACNSTGLVGYWNFDESTTSQSVLDCSPEGNNGTVGGSSSIGTDDPERVASTAPVFCDPCPVIAVSPFYQTGPHAPWGSQIYDTPSTWDIPPEVGTIAVWGCGITCLAMLVNKYGITTDSDGFPVDPEHLNNWMNNHGGYDHNGNIVNWNKMYEYSRRKLVYKGGTTNKDKRSVQDALVLSDLQAGRPVILRVKFVATSRKIYDHFVLATGKSDCIHYEIRDPLENPQGYSRTSLSESPYNNIYYYIRRFEYSPNGSKALADFHPSLMLSSYDPLSFSTIDSAGNRCGYDPASDSIFQETPEISYFEDLLTPSGAADDSTLTHDSLASSLLPRKSLYWTSQPRHVVRVETHPFQSGQFQLRVDYTVASDSTLSSVFSIISDSGTSKPLWVSLTDSSAPLLIPLCGDANGDAAVDISDAVSLIAYIFSGGPAPVPLLAGDANCDSTVDISDAVYLIAYIFSGGLAPCTGCK
jgi:hypothetical protein